MIARVVDRQRQQCYAVDHGTVEPVGQVVGAGSTNFCELLSGVITDR